MSAHRRAWIVIAVAAVVALTTVSSALARKPVLRPGAHGAGVAQMQRQLLKTGLAVTPTGYYGSATIAAVEAFQNAANLRVTGIADHATRHKLHLVTMLTAATASVVSVPGGVTVQGPTIAHRLGDRIPLQRGMDGADVTQLQQLLTKAGDKADVNGTFDTSTVRAVRKFERDTGLTIDGVVDAADIDSLRGDVSVSDPGGTSSDPLPLAPGDRATIGSDGLAVAPASAPVAVQQIIAAGNAIAHTPYRYGGGHGSFHDSAYDCSGSVSYALHGAALIKTTMDSSELESWGSAGAGQWVTIYANSGHTYMVVAGLRFDTSGASGHDGDRWQTDMRPGDGYVVRHPTGL